MLIGGSWAHLPLDQVGDRDEFIAVRARASEADPTDEDH